MGNALRDRTVVVAGRDRAKLAEAYGDGGVTAEAVDVTDDESIAALVGRVGAVDHVVSTASARARGKLGELQRRNLVQSFDTKVIGPTMLAKYCAPQIKPGGSVVLFSGVHAFKLNPGADKGRDYFRHIAATNPARRIGTVDDVAGAVLFAMTNTFMTGMTLKIDGGEPLV